MIRYFNLKVGSEEVHGDVLKVDTSAPLEKRINSFYNGSDDKFTATQVMGKKRALWYDLTFPNIKYTNMPGRDALGGVIGVPVPVETEAATVVRVKISKTGKMEIVNSPHKAKVYLTEISASKARRLREGKDSFDLLRAYVME